ncbi:MAG: hypothetical protein FRX49_11214 [Trebouxia sp. A1-2]|nr:MAG: hypothetical protein FRX49_11214 [Trebouxia sp. A1-2]
MASFEALAGRAEVYLVQQATNMQGKRADQAAAYRRAQDELLGAPQAAPPPRPFEGSAMPFDVVMGRAAMPQTEKKNSMVYVLVMRLTLERKKSLGPAGALAYRDLPKVVQICKGKH